jgi:hypothetical protein
MKGFERSESGHRLLYIVTTVKGFSHDLLHSILAKGSLSLATLVKPFPLKVFYQAIRAMGPFGNIRTRTFLNSSIHKIPTARGSG